MQDFYYINNTASSTQKRISRCFFLPLSKIMYLASSVNFVNFIF